MEYKAFQDIQLSRLGMGNMRLPTVGEGGAIDFTKAAEIIDYGYNHGINYFDTAYVYHNGESEKVVGEVLSKYPRESYRLATKFFILANPDYKAVFEEQLQKLTLTAAALITFWSRRQRAVSSTWAFPYMHRYPLWSALPAIISGTLPRFRSITWIGRCRMPRASMIC